MSDGAKIYISGPITGLTNYAQDFITAEKEIVKLDPSYIPINPAKLGVAFGDALDYSDYMEIDLEILKHCDGIYMLRGWEDSRGARLELDMAKVRGMMIYYQTEERSPSMTSFEDVYRAFSRMRNGGYVV